MRIIILAWGSLIWNPRDLPISGKWQQDGPPSSRLWRTGPALSIEFSRISGVARASRPWSNLRFRPWPMGRMPMPQHIKAWAQTQHLDAVVWMALPSNFEEVAYCPFSVEAAIHYLKDLSKPANSRALEYLQKSPPEVMTPVGEAVIKAGLISPPQHTKP